MAAEISEITPSNQDAVAGYLEHILTDLHSALKLLTEQGTLLARHDALLAEFRPLLDQFRVRPAATMLAARKARRMNGA